MATPARWTLGQIRAGNMQLEACCRTPGCHHFVTFDLDQLIENAGPDYELPDDCPGVTCPTCGATNMQFQLAMLHPDSDDLNQEPRAGLDNTSKGTGDIEK
jgi:hypothetical protein